jgi:hypothetical protein
VQGHATESNSGSESSSKQAEHGVQLSVSISISLPSPFVSLSISPDLRQLVNDENALALRTRRGLHDPHGCVRERERERKTEREKDREREREESDRHDSDSLSPAAVQAHLLHLHPLLHHLPLGLRRNSSTKME